MSDSKFKYDEDGYRVDQYPWEERGKAKTTEEAMLYLAERLSDDGIPDMVANQLDEVESYCESYLIPFSRDMWHRVMKAMDDKRWDIVDEEYWRTQHYWTSSSEGC